jgi:hypothetical protein
MKKQNNSIASYAGLGLVFGTAVGAIISISIGQPIFWAGVGTAIGLIIGSIISTSKSK